MDANNPTVNNQIAIWVGDWAVEAPIADKPIPMKKTLIMPSRLHLSASQPEGRENKPNATKPAVEYGISSPYGSCHSETKTSAAADAKISTKNGLGSDQHSKIENVVYLSIFSCILDVKFVH